jgi:hypothetical protein
VEITLDGYVVEVLMRDLVGHDKSPSAFLVYLYIWGQTIGKQVETAALSHQKMADATGLSKSAVQIAIRVLTRRKLIRAHRENVTAIPEYRVLRPWKKRS